MMNQDFNLKRFMLSRFVAALADQILLFAVPLIILKTTGSVVYSGLAFAIEWTPRLLLLPFTGTIADLIDVNKLYRFGDGARMVTVFAIGILLYFNAIENVFWVLSAMMAILAICNSLVFIGLESTLSKNIPTSDMPKAQSYLQACDQLSQVLGPALAALLIAFMPMTSLLFISSVCFLISLINALNMPTLKAKSSTRKIQLSDFLSTLNIATRIIGNNPILIQLMSLTWIINIVYGSFLVLVPALVVKHFELEESIFGVLQTTSAVFTITLFSFVPYILKRIGLIGIAWIASIGLFSGALLASTSSLFLLTAIGVICVFSSDGLFNVYIRSLRAQIIPKEHFGKTTGFIIMCNNLSIPLSGLAVAKLAAHYDPRESLLILSLFATSLYIAVNLIGRKLINYKTSLPSLDFVQKNKYGETIKPLEVL